VSDGDVQRSQPNAEINLSPDELTLLREAVAKAADLEPDATKEAAYDAEKLESAANEKRPE
jgi:hypothetical protein